MTGFSKNTTHLSKTCRCGCVLEAMCLRTIGRLYRVSRMVLPSQITYLQNSSVALNISCSQITCCCTMRATECLSKRMGRNAGFILCVTISGSNSSESTSMHDSKSSSAVISSMTLCLSFHKDAALCKEVSARTRVCIRRAPAHNRGSYMVHGRIATRLQVGCLE